MTDERDIDVLVVDDIEGTADDYARIIAAGTGFHVEARDDGEAALALMAERSVKILVLDQKMPMRGTEVFRRARQINPHVRGIMLTSEATQKEVGEAIGLGFSEYVEKGSIRDRLVDVVRHEYAEYQAGLAKRNHGSNQPVLLEIHPRGRFLSRATVTYRLQGLAVTEENFVFDNEWATLASIHVGQSERVTIGVRAEKELVLSAEAEQALVGEFGMSARHLAGVEATLRSEIRERFSRTIGVKELDEATVERTFELPAEPADPDQIHVRLRRVQAAPSYRKVRVDLIGECSACVRPHMLSFSVFLPTKRRAIRHEDFLSDERRRVHKLGYE